VAAAQTAILPLGDSITRGTGSFDFQGGQYPESAYRNASGGPPGNLRSYREHLHDLLNDPACNADIEWVGSQRLGGRTPEVHEGHSGWRVNDYLDKSWPDQTGLYGGVRNFVDWLPLLAPDVVLVHLGTNDLGQNQSVSSTGSELQTLLDRIFANDASTQVFVANVIPPSGWFADHAYTSPGQATDIAARTVQLGGLISNLVSQEQANGRDIHLVDVSSGFYVDESNTVSCPAATGGDPDNMSLTACVIEPGTTSTSIPDGVHPGLVGERFIAEQFFDKLQSVRNICPGGGSGPDTEAPFANIDTPSSSGQTFAANPTFDGTATDAGGSGFDRVRIVVRDNVTGHWLNFSNGQFGPQSGGLPDRDATLTNTTTSSTDWSVSLPVSTPGNYELFALGYDNAGNIREADNGFKLWTQRQFLIGSNDTQPPTTRITTPSANNLTFPGTITFAGTASDTGGSGLDRVEILIYNRNSNRWFDFNAGSFRSGFHKTIANLGNTSPSATDWSLNVMLPPGNFRVYARAIDGNGNIRRLPNGNTDWARRNLVVSNGDAEPPVAKITTPSANNLSFPSTITFAGTATDEGGSGFDRVEILVLDRSTNRWFDFAAGSFRSGFHRTTATLSNTSTSLTNWSLSVTLPPGNLRVYARAIDNEGNIRRLPNGNTNWARRNLVVASGT